MKIMKTNNKKSPIILYVILVCFTLFTSCNRDDDYEINNTNNSNFSENFGNVVTKDFMGRIIDINNNPISSVAIKIGDKTAITDINGMFIINGASVYQKFAYISAKKAGFLDGSRSLVPSIGVNNVNIMLLNDNPTTAINTGVASEVSLSSGTKVNFDGFFQDASGATYSGVVQVSLKELKSSNPDIDKIMPGMLYAQRTNNQAAVLETFGMLNVQLTGSGGQKLQIADGHSAQITMDIDVTQLSSSPTTIPLWHFDEENGYWIEEGFATKTGNKYVGTVSHFSWWNYGAPFDQANLVVNVVDSNNNPISNVRVNIFQSGTATLRGGITNILGQIAGIIPANETLNMVVADICGATIFSSSSIGPFPTNSTTSIPNIVIPISLTTSVVGSLNKCDGTNVTNGYLQFKYNTDNSSNFIPVTNGNVNFKTIVCSASNAFTLQGYDYDTLNTTGVLNYTYNNPVTNIGNISACNTITEFISYQIDNNPVELLLSNINADYYIAGAQPTNGLTISAQNNNNTLYLLGNTNFMGVYDTSSLRIGATFGSINALTPNNVVFNINSYAAIGQYVDITFNGTYTDTTGLHTITGTVHVIRDN